MRSPKAQAGQTSPLKRAKYFIFNALPRLKPWPVTQRPSTPGSGPGELGRDKAPPAGLQPEAVLTAKPSSFLTAAAPRPAYPRQPVPPPRGIAAPDGRPASSRAARIPAPRSLPVLPCRQRPTPAAVENLVWCPRNQPTEAARVHGPMRPSFYGSCPPKPRRRRIAPAISRRVARLGCVSSAHAIRW